VVIASLGLAAHVFSERMYAVIIAMSLLTSVVAPPVLAAMLRHSGEVPELEPRDSEAG
jgi:Na+:H+ antiporter